MLNGDRFLIGVGIIVAIVGCALGSFSIGLAALGPLLLVAMGVFDRRRSIR